MTTALPPLPQALNLHEPVLVVGAGSHALQLVCWLREGGFELCNLYLLEKASNLISLWPSDQLPPNAVLKEPDDLDELPTLFTAVGLPPRPQALLGIGQANRADAHRLAVFEKLAPFVDWRYWCHPSAVVAATATLSQGCTVGAMAVVQPQAKVGPACLINTAAVIEHDVSLAAGVHVAPCATLLGGVHVGESALLGANSTVLPYLRVAAHTTLGAGAVLTQQALQPGGLWVGLPARSVLNSN
jgi:UDP-3-O-[3-hydroxymyristoyl] glucosamine N-acyltransferase